MPLCLERVPQVDLEASFYTFGDIGCIIGSQKIAHTLNAFITLKLTGTLNARVSVAAKAALPPTSRLSSETRRLGKPQ